MSRQLPAWALLGVALLLTAPNVTWANLGDLDSMFGTGGKVTTTFGTVEDEGA